jgi:hypothetical protein
VANANNKTKKTRASVAKFLGALDDERRRDCEILVAMLRRLTKAEPKMWGSSIVGFGDCHYKSASGREADWFVAGFSPRKKDLTLYVMGRSPFDDPLMAKLGKHSTGKGCLHIKRLSDVDVGVLEDIVRRWARSSTGSGT